MKTTDQTIDWEAELPLHREWMVRTARSRLGDPHVAEDVVQDVFLSIVRQNPQLDDPTRIRSWLYQAVVHRVSDQLRTEYRRTRAVNGMTEQILPEQEELGWDWLLAKEQRDLLKTAVGQLPELDREIVLLRFGHNWTYNRLAERLGMTARAVEYRLVRAKQNLRRELQRLNGFDHE